MLLSIAAIFFTKNEVKQDIISGQKYRIHSVEISLDSIFKQQEQMFDIMISYLLQLDSIKDTETLSQLFKQR